MASLLELRHQALSIQWTAENEASFVITDKLSLGHYEQLNVGFKVLFVESFWLRYLFHNLVQKSLAGYWVKQAFLNSNFSQTFIQQPTEYWNN